MLRFVEGIRVNRKAVYRLLMLKGLCEGHGEKGASLSAVPGSVAVSKVEDNASCYQIDALVRCS